MKDKVSLWWKNKPLSAKVKGIIMAVALTWLVFPYLSYEEYTVTVTDKLRVDGQYLIYTDKGTFSIKDSWRYLNIRSHDLYGAIVVNSQYTIGTTGFRNGLLSITENIVDVDGLKY